MKNLIQWCSWNWAVALDFNKDGWDGNRFKVTISRCRLNGEVGPMVSIVAGPFLLMILHIAPAKMEA